MRLDLSAPHEACIRSTQHRGSCYGAFAIVTVAFVPQKTPGYRFIQAVEFKPGDIRGDYARAVGEGVLAGLADPYEAATITTSHPGIHVARFEMGDDYFDSPLSSADSAAAQLGLALRVEMRSLYYDEADSNERAFRRAGWLAVRAAVDGESDLRYRY